MGYWACIFSAYIIASGAWLWCQTLSQRLADLAKMAFFFLRNSFLKLFIYLFIYGCVGSSGDPKRGLSPVAASGGHSSSRCVGLSLSRPLLLQSTGSRRAGSVVVAHGPSCSTACGILPDQGLNPCPCIGRQILNHCATREAPKMASW